MKEIEYRGVPVSRGIVISEVLKYGRQKIDISKQLLQKAEIENHVALFYSSRENTRKQLKRIYQKSLKTLGEEKAEIFEGYIEILMDDEIEESVLANIKNNSFSCDRAVDTVFEENAKEMESLENEYMRERASDIRSIKLLMLSNIKGIVYSNSLEALEKPIVVIAIDLEPADTATMDKKNVLGFAIEKGGITSHVSIMAKSLEIPAVIGIENIFDEVESGDTIILDSIEGKVFINPCEKTLESYRNKLVEFYKEQESLYRLKELAAVTLDGHQVKLAANIGNIDDLKAALKYGAEGIGLFRSEFLFMNTDTMPNENQQFEIYKEVAQKMNHKPVIIRTLDVGGDKEIPYIKIPEEENPFLGYRAIRLCLKNPEVFSTQLRAILRASAFGKIRILLPMIISVSEVLQVKKIIATLKEELGKEDIKFDENIEIGIMIETPAAAIIADKLIEEVDFFSIGTNDLTQYTLAVDRGNKKINELYNPFHPAVLNLIMHVIEVSHRAGKWTGMCGEFAGNPKAVKLLLAMGLDEFSTSASDINRVKSIIRSSNKVELKNYSEKILEQNDVDKVLDIIDNYS